MRERKTLHRTPASNTGSRDRRLPTPHRSEAPRAPEAERKPAPGAGLWVPRPRARPAPRQAGGRGTRIPQAQSCLAAAFPGLVVGLNLVPGRARRRASVASWGTQTILRARSSRGAGKRSTGHVESSPGGKPRFPGATR